MTASRRSLGAVLIGLAVAVAVAAQTPNRTPAPPAGKGRATSDVELVEKVLAARRDYQVSLEGLRAHYISVNDTERARWAEEELREFHRVNKQAYNLDLDVPPPTLKSDRNVPEANELYKRAMTFKEKGWGSDYVDNQRRAELLFQQILTTYPDSDKIDDTAYRLGELYEGKAYKQYKRAATYYQRCFQWNPKTHFDARLRAARLYDKVLMDRTEAIRLYEEVLQHETEPAWEQEAKKRLQELRGTRP
jgi:tetratricopeptide (TPR) repeat protein